MQVKKWMSAPPVSVTPETPVLDAQQIMERRAIRHLPVVDGSRLVGIASDRDIRLHLPPPITSMSTWEAKYLTVSNVMTRTPVTLDPERPAEEAARLMLERRIGAVPVVEGDRLVGIVTTTDLLRAWVA
jgi:acetoin utilization protein AcuB